MDKQQFIELVKRDCELNNVVFQIENSNTIKTLVIGTECSGRTRFF